LVKIIKINPEHLDIEKIKEIGKQLRSGKIVVFPTDTVYGIGCDAYNIEAIKKIYKIKNRKMNKGMPVLISSIDKLHNFVITNETADILIQKFWPGQLTIILPKVVKAPEILTGGSSSIAVRQPNNPITISIAKEVECGGIVGTSANLSGNKEPITIKEAINQLGDEVDIYIDGGTSHKKIPSTIIDLTSKPLKLIRKGPISFEDIKDTIKNELDQ